MSPLLNLTPFIPGESLLSWLIRLKKLNDYDSLHTLSSIIYEKISYKGDSSEGIGRPKQREIYDLLAELTKRKVEDLYAATPHIFSTILVPPGSQVQYLTLPDQHTVPILGQKFAHGHLLPNSASQFCPQCLGENPYHRLSWVPLALSICLKHQCYLVEKCFQCGKAIKVTDVVSTLCSKCRANFRAFHTNSVVVDDFSLLVQQVLNEWFMRSAMLPENAYQLPAQPLNVLYRVLTGIRLILLTFKDVDWPYFSSIEGKDVKNLHLQTRSAKDRYHEYAAAFKVLIDWPQNFFNFLHVCRDQSDKDKLGRRRGETDLGNIYTRWIKTYWKHPAFAFLQEAFDQYVFNYCQSSQWVFESRRYRKHTNFSNNFDLISITEASEILGMAFHTVKSLLKAERLTNYKAITEPHYQRETLISRAEVLALQTQLEERITLTEVSLLLDISLPVLSDLIEIGLLAPKQTGNSMPSTLLTKSEVMTFLERVREYAEPEPLTEWPQEDLLDLEEVTQLAASTIGLNTTKVLLNIFEDKLHVYYKARDHFQLSCLVFVRSDVQAWIEAFKRERHWMGQEAVIKVLGVKYETYLSWVKLDLLTPVAIVGTRRFFDSRVIEQFRVRYVRSDEAANILGIKVSCLLQWIKRGWLKETFIGDAFTKAHHSYYLFDREALVRWRNERLPSADAAQLMGINQEALRYLVRRGKLNPLPGMGTCPYWFKREDLLKWQSGVDLDLNMEP